MPKTDQKLSQIEYVKSSWFDIANIVVDDNAENITIYMPVAPLTTGETPISIKTGLKMLPPPCPKAPAMNPPKNEKNKRILKV